MRNRRIGVLARWGARFAFAVLALIAACVPVAWASAGFPSSSLQVVLAPTPVFLNDTHNVGGFDLDASPVLCQTESYTPTSESTARMDSWVNLGFPGSPITFTVRNAISENGGTWQEADSIASVATSHGISAESPDIGFAENSAIVDLTPGTSYVFGVRVGRASGQGDPPGGACEVLVEITEDFVPADPPIPAPAPQ